MNWIEQLLLKFITNFWQHWWIGRHYPDLEFLFSPRIKLWLQCILVKHKKFNVYVRQSNHNCLVFVTSPNFSNAGVEKYICLPLLASIKFWIYFLIWIGNLTQKLFFHLKIILAYMLLHTQIKIPLLTHIIISFHTYRTSLQLKSKLTLCNKQKIQLLLSQLKFLIISNHFNWYLFKQKFQNTRY